jgi:8-oxo-dGTP pyrophosphatase MutT (NUDIX family)
MSENRKAKTKAVRVQYGALPYRQLEDGTLQILLVTSRQSKRWILPKGWPIKGLKPAKSAAREAYEEAGVRGVIAPKAVGSFRYDKTLEDDGRIVPCEIHVFPLLVERQHKTWPERLEREVRWLQPSEAVALLDDPGAQDLISAFVDRKMAAKGTGDR